MRCSKEEALMLISKWREEDRWLSLWTMSGDLTGGGAQEEHSFWAKPSDLLAPPADNQEWIAFAGEHATIEFPLEPDATFEYLEPRDAPEPIRARFRGFDFALLIRSTRVFAVIFGPRIEGLT